MTSVLDAEGLRVDLGGTEILHGVDVSLSKGEVVALIGPNGAGKTTLIETLAGLDRPRAGVIRYDGRVATGLQGAALASRSVRANLELALAFWGVPKKQRATRVDDWLDRLGIAHLADRSARTLSGGETRRVHLARLLVLEPAVLLLDEPFAGLDVNARADLLYEAASALRSGERATMIVVHDRAEAWALADRVLVLLDGQIRASGTPSEVFADPPSIEVARFVGFTGTYNRGGEVLALRPTDVVLRDDGELIATVRRRVPLEEGIRLDLSFEDGQVVAVVPEPGPPLGASVRLDIVGGVRFADAVDRTTVDPVT